MGGGGHIKENVWWCHDEDRVCFDGRVEILVTSFYGNLILCDYTCLSLVRTSLKPVNGDLCDIHNLVF